jgi:carbonic anhydrase/acetyltransferase-like protein (isoleucine patch superfamily)
MLIEHQGQPPTVHPTAHVAPTAVLCGDVTVGPGCVVAFGAVIVAEGGPVRLGRQVIVREQALIRATTTQQVTIGDHVLVGPHAMLRGCTIADECFLATGVSIFDGARIGPQSEVRIGAVVHVNTALEANALVPIGWIAIGDPAETFPPDAHDDYNEKLAALRFPETVYGLERLDRPGADVDMRAVTSRLAEAAGRHNDDRVL